MRDRLIFFGEVIDEVQSYETFVEEIDVSLPTTLPTLMDHSDAPGIRGVTITNLKELSTKFCGSPVLFERCLKVIETKSVHSTDIIECALLRLFFRVCMKSYSPIGME